MGNCQSNKAKNHRRSPKRSPTIPFIMSNEMDGGVISQKQYDEAEVCKLRNELIETPQIFVMNNLLMSVMFFDNYEREKQKLLSSSRTTMEKELNPSLLRDETIECVTPDVIFDSVNKNVRFQRTHGHNKNQIEPLAPRRIYVVNDNIEVLESKHTPQYSAIDKPSYQVVMEDSEKSGFVKLKCAPSQPRQISKTDSDPQLEPKPGPSSQPDNEEYGYLTITQVNTPKPLNITNCERRDTLPKTCFTSRKIPKYDINADSSDEDEENEKQPQKIDQLYDTVSYISSSGFMTYFQNAVFPNSLGRALGFETTEIKVAKAIPGRIFCNLHDVDEEFISLPCEIVPSVAIQWPINQTFEFHQREERPTMWDKFNMEYRWPQDSMIKDIRGLNCVLIPRGYIPKRGENPDSDIEWEVGFPKAERYLDTHMMHTQVRAFLFLLAIYKTYIEPKTQQYGLLAEHIRTHMYWECESNPRDWPEHRLGSRLVLVIKNLIQKLSRGELPNFFIKKKNVFENVPNRHLQFAQRIFHEVLEAPALYFIGALRNLHYTNARFYPQLNMRQLYTILTAENVLKTVTNRLLEPPPNLNPKIRRQQVAGDANYRKEINWKIKIERLNREKKLKEMDRKKQEEENLNRERRGSVDSIDFSWQCEQRFDTLKMRLLLIFFINHFIEIAKRSRRLASQRQALFYLKQSYYLTKILESFGLVEDAKEWMEIITMEEDSCKKQSVTESFEMPPSTPKRNSAQFNWELTQQVKTQYVNLNNLNKSYNQGSAPLNFNKLKKHPSNLKGRSSLLSLEPRRSVGFSETVEIR